MKSLFASLVLVTALHAAPPERNRWGSPRFHDPSTPIRQGDRWHVFATGNGIVTRTSADLKTWTEGEPVLKELPSWHREVVPEHKGHLWAPDVIQRGERFLLYYSVSSWGKNASAIGLLSSSTLEPGSWKDEGIVIRSTEKSNFNAIDPQLFADADGSLWMVFGSFWSGIQLIELDPETGLQHPERKKVRQLAWHESIEAPALLFRDGYYHLFVNWGRCCRGLESTYEIRVGRSRKITGPYLDADGNELATGGGTLLMKSEGDRIGPGHPCFVEENGALRMFFHYYDKRRNGAPTIGDVPLGWTADGWPKID
jgi:arabinan endo-1,5-alpha-L-arabinosidase